MGQYGDSFIRFAGDFSGKKYFIKNSDDLKELLQNIDRNVTIKIKGLGTFDVLDNWKHWTKTDQTYNEIVLRKF